jgi:hypothetical protein
MEQKTEDSEKLIGRESHFQKHESMNTEKRGVFSNPWILEIYKFFK